MSNFQPIIKCSDQFRPLYNVPPNTKLILALGGRGGMKTYEVSKSAAYHCTLGGKRIQILRDEETRIKDSILSEILTHYDKANISSGNRLDKYFNRLENGIKLRSNGDSVLFTKGFRQSSLEKSAGMKGVANVDIAIIEEGEDVRDKFLFNSYHDSLRKANEAGELVSYIIFIMNPPDVNHFIIRDYYDLVPVEAKDHPECLAKDVEGYFKLIPKQLDGVIYIFTTYKDNKYLPTLTKEKYELYGIHSIDGKPNPFYDPHYYLNQIMGYCTTGRKGQYFKRYQMISNEEYMALPYTEVYGLDFGTTSPAGLIAVKAHRNNIYVKELNYEPLPVKQLGFEMDRLGLKGDSLIVADCAEPETIKTLRYGQAHTMSQEEIQRYPVCAMGFGNIRESPDKRIEAGISRLLGMNIHVVSGSDNLINEFANYCEAVDRNGIGTGKPVDAYNHLIDPLRYVSAVIGKWF